MKLKIKNEELRIEKGELNHVKNYSLFIINSKLARRAGFTLAEVLITLGIIGVVAAVTMPTLITNINERRNSERQANIAQKITQAMEHMRALGKLTQYNSTEDFVNELKNHLKISKICYQDNIAECWPTTTITDKEGNEYNVADAKTGKKIGKFTTTNNVGLILADGASIILNYNNSANAIDIGDRVAASTKSLPVGSGKSKDFPYTSSVTNSIDFIMDVNGKGNPNKEADGTKFYDIRSFKTASFTDIPWDNNGGQGTILVIPAYSYSTVNCSASNSSSDDYRDYCGDTPSGYENDGWAGAQRACVIESRGQAKLASASKLTDIYNDRDIDPTHYPSITYLGWTYTIDETSATEGGVFSTYDARIHHYNKRNTYQAICIKN